MARSNSYEMGVPAVPLGELYGSEAWKRIGNVRLHPRAPVERAIIENNSVRAVVSQGEERSADYYVSALPFERVPAVFPQLDLPLDGFEHSPITGVHLWFDRSVTQLAHATLLDRTVQWMFNKSGGRYLQIVISASRSLVDMSRNEVVELAVRELAEFLPRVREAKLEKAHVVKEVRATFSPRPGMEPLRPTSATKFANLFLAGDWTRSGWPPTMEGAVRSGYLAAEAVTGAAGLAKTIPLARHSIKAMSKPIAKSFQATLERGGGALNWVIVRIPFDVSKLWGKRGQLRVRGEINDFAFRTSLFPTGDGRHILLVNKGMQKGGRAGLGVTARFRLEPDTEKREVAIPRGTEEARSRKNPRLASLVSTTESVGAQRYRPVGGGCKERRRPVYGAPNRWSSECSPPWKPNASFLRFCGWPSRATLAPKRAGSACRPHTGAGTCSASSITERQTGVRAASQK